MRPIKFRAWDRLNREMIGGQNIYPLTKATYHLADADVIELMQYTGLKDKNGKEIYEGDILRHIGFNWKQVGHPANKTNLTHICRVWWDKERLAFRADGKFEGGGGFGWGFPLKDDRADKTEVEVIGNIYENPLEG